MFVILYNYPLSEEEFMCLENEKNENNDEVTINLFHLMNDIDEYVPPQQEEVVLDKKGKPIQKEAKLDKDQALIQKYFTSTLLIPKKDILDTENDEKKDDEMNDTKTSKMNKKEEEKKEEEKKDENEDEMIEVVLSDIYNKFIELKDNSDKFSKLRQSCFEKEDFTYKILNEETQEDTISEFYKNFLVKIARMHAQYVYYQNWSKEKKLIKLLEDDQHKAKEFSINNCISINSNVDYENDSIGRSLLAFCADLIKERRIDNRNDLIYTINNFDGVFNDNLDLFTYEFLESQKYKIESPKIENKEIENKKEEEESIGFKSKLSDIKNKKSAPVIENLSNSNLNSVTPSPYQIKQSHSSQIDTFNFSKDILSNNLNKQENKDKNESLSHPILSEKKEHSKVDSSMSKCDKNSSPFNIIIDYHDDIYKISLEEKINDRFVFLAEKNFNLFLQMPKINECIEKYYNLKVKDYIFNKGKTNEIYYYMLKRNIPRCVYDKYYYIKFFEEMISEKVPERKINLGNRIYEENYDKDLFKQELNKIMMFDYETYAKFDERNNKTLLACFYRCPKGRVYRRRKFYRYLSKPDFENWIKYFAPKFKQVGVNEKEEDSKNKTQSKLEKNSKKKEKNIMNETSKTGFKFEIELKDDKNNMNTTSTSLLKKNLDPNNKKEEEKDELPIYEADDLKVGETSERIKYMFPSDNGVFVKKLLENGIFNTTVSYVRKNDLVFGIKKNDENLNEFWLNFSDGLKLSVIFKDNYTGLFNNNENPVDMNAGSISSLTLPDGLLVQILPAGEICMKHYKNVNNQSTNFSAFSLSEEQYRIISSRATVIRNFPLETKIQYCTGNTCSIMNNLATNTNNKGFRLARNINDENDINENESILITKNFEKDTNTHSIVKQDNVLIIDYPDKSKYVIHSDNTKIYTSPTYKEVTHYIIENDNYPSVEIIYDQVKKRTQTCIAAGSTEALMGSDNLMTRSYDGRLSKIVLPNNTLVYTYKEKKATEEFNVYSYNTVTLISRNDGTIIRINQDGDIVIITSNERKRLNDLGMKKNFDELLDVDYLFELNGKNSERKGGIYTCDLAKGKIWTRDDETNIFEIHSNGIAKCKIEGTTVPEKNIDDIEPNSPRYKEDFYIHPEVRFSEVRIEDEKEDRKNFMKK